MTDREQAFCLFQGDSGPMAVAVESVAAVLETESLVPLVWRPPPVVGICAYHRDGVPVISLGPTESAGKADVKGEPSPCAAAMAVTPVAKVGDEEEARCIVLVLRSEHDAWGLRIDRAGTFISREKPECHAPRLGGARSVVHRVPDLRGQTVRHS